MSALGEGRQTYPASRASHEGVAHTPGVPEIGGGGGGGEPHPISSDQGQCACHRRHLAATHENWAGNRPWLAEATARSWSGTGSAGTRGFLGGKRAASASTDGPRLAPPLELLQRARCARHSPSIGFCSLIFFDRCVPCFALPAPSPFLLINSGKHETHRDPPPPPPKLMEVRGPV